MLQTLIAAYTAGLIMLASMNMMATGDTVTIFLCGDVMTGRGVDQILPHPSDPVIHESYMKSARGYVEIAERASGPLPGEVGFSYIWGDALNVFDRMNPDLKIINLETSITLGDDYWKGKGINYRMHPANVSCLTAAEIDFCSLANNHLLDWGYEGLSETLETLQQQGIQFAGAGENHEAAGLPAVFRIAEDQRVLIFAYGMADAGIPHTWQATGNRPGVNLLRDYSAKSFRHVKHQILAHRKVNDIVIVTIHWGSNWGYHVPEAQQQFAHRLVDEAGVDIIHGHSSHHVRPLEVYKDRLILYGCGDFLNDYEGIGGHEQYRSDLCLMYFVQMKSQTGKITGITMVPMQINRFQLRRAIPSDALWLSNMLNRECRTFKTRVELTGENLLRIKRQQ